MSDTSVFGPDLLDDPVILAADPAAVQEFLDRPELLDDPALRAADQQAVQAFFNTGAPVAAIIGARVRARAERIKWKAFRKHGYIDIDALRPPTTYDE